MHLLEQRAHESCFGSLALSISCGAERNSICPTFGLQRIPYTLGCNLQIRSFFERTCSRFPLLTVQWPFTFSVWCSGNIDASHASARGPIPLTENGGILATVTLLIYVNFSFLTAHLVWYQTAHRPFNLRQKCSELSGHPNES